MADQRKTKPKPKPRARPRPLGPFEAATPPVEVEQNRVMRRPPPPPPPSNIPSPEVQQRIRQQLEDQRMDEAMDRAADISRRSSMGTYKEERKAKGGMVGSASKRADGCAQRGKTRGKFI